MAYSEEILRRAKARLAQARQEQQETYEAHLREAYARYPRLQEIDRELRATMEMCIRDRPRSRPSTAASPTTNMPPRSAGCSSVA